MLLAAAEKADVHLENPSFAAKGARQLVKLLRGAKPGDIPVEHPTAFELVINLQAARATADDAIGISDLAQDQPLSTNVANLARN